MGQGLDPTKNINRRQRPTPVQAAKPAKPKAPSHPSPPSPHSVRAWWRRQLVQNLAQLRWTNPASRLSSERSCIFYFFRPFSFAFFVLHSRRSCVLHFEYNFHNCLECFVHSSLHLQKQNWLKGPSLRFWTRTLDSCPAGSPGHRRQNWTRVQRCLSFSARWTKLCDVKQCEHGTTTLSETSKSFERYHFSRSVDFSLLCSVQDGKFTVYWTLDTIRCLRKIYVEQSSPIF